MNPQTLPRKALYKTKIFLHKTIKNLKSFLFGGYKKLPKAPYVNPSFFNVSSNGCKTMQELDDFYRCFSEQWESNDHYNDVLDKTKNKVKVQPPKPQIMSKDEEESTQRRSNTAEKINAEGKKEEVLRNSNTLMKFAQKMKEFDMLDIDDVDHILDVEEVLHYYSRLRCPIYQELVDKFFMDMYYEFLPQQPSVGVNSSMRKFAPLKQL